MKTRRHRNIWFAKHGNRCYWGKIGHHVKTNRGSIFVILRKYNLAVPYRKLVEKCFEQNCGKHGRSS